MGFTTNTFTFLFFPVLLVIYFLLQIVIPERVRPCCRKLLLILAGLIFYAWGSAPGAVFLLFYAAAVYALGYLIKKFSSIELPVPYYSGEMKLEGRIRVSGVILAAGVAAAVFILFHFKYESVLADFMKDYFYVDPVKYENIIAPLGISFITFSAVTYVTDIYRGEAEPGSFTDSLLYFFFFPKVVSGPIVPWKDFSRQTGEGNVSSGEVVNGLNRIAVGFGKKVILADTLGFYASQIADVPVDLPTAWFGWILYAMQIYYDFSGYSDVAIGISEIFGFQFEDNFRFPYLSVSVTEFWRRWHISLGTFFRNYLYIPLGGNRKGQVRTLINLGIVFAVTGIWHGAGMAYIVWGFLHGACVIFERLVRNRNWYQRVPRFLKWAVTFFICTSAWQFFRYGDLAQAGNSFARMAGLVADEGVCFPWQHYVDVKITAVLVIALMGALLFGNEKLISIWKKVTGIFIGYLLQEVIVVAVFIMSVIFMINSTYSPFIYFQF